MLKMQFKNNLAIFWLLPGKLEEIEVDSKLFLFFFISGKLNIKSQIGFT